MIVRFSLTGTGKRPSQFGINGTAMGSLDQEAQVKSFIMDGIVVMPQV